MESAAVPAALTGHAVKLVPYQAKHVMQYHAWMQVYNLPAQPALHSSVTSTLTCA